MTKPAQKDRTITQKTKKNTKKGEFFHDAFAANSRDQIFGKKFLDQDGPGGMLVGKRYFLKGILKKSMAK